MKKKVLFIMNSLTCGGAEKALISLLETLDYSKYDVDLFLLKHEGIFFNKIPSEVNLLREPQNYKYFEMPMGAAVLDCLRKGRLGVAVARVIAGFIYKSEKNSARSEQRAWKYLYKALPDINTKYDAAVGYLEKNPIYFCIDKVRATKKLGFIHSDYNKMGMDAKLDNGYFRKLDHIVTVSEECQHILKKIFPKYIQRIEVMHNIVSPAAIRKLSLEEIHLGGQELKIVSVGRLNYHKGFELAIESCKELVNTGYQVKWYIIGEGEERKNLERIIDHNKLNDTIKLVGIKENPYPYIKAADIYVQPSRFEGKSIAIDEAKILYKPIVVTDFDTAKDQITDQVNGLIVGMNPKSLSAGIASLIDNPSLRKQFSQNLSTENLGTEDEIHKLYAMFN
ncbi:glycosyltransferase [Paenibacillus sp. LMG 31461]|uniref:Glycosyltransferase n=1 Tax=Paenibacillus plantarum TaxID=2654975 RepID=A0ABX1XAH9_9BACL|nr:glycosyltransferase [Paenibacillus plantarum]NOU65181.1 glycosyltransferase [Paenibacillus plantarum]